MKQVSQMNQVKRKKEIYVSWLTLLRMRQKAIQVTLLPNLIQTMIVYSMHSKSYMKRHKDLSL